jgi:hypothetical protein
MDAPDQTIDRIGVIVDGGSLARWQADALAALGGDCRFTFYNCTNMRSQPRRLAHWPYYALNLLSLRMRLTRQVPLPLDADDVVVDFECEHEGIWQRLPASLIERITADRAVVIVKFGMGLLRVPDDAAFPIPILSYHHGDLRRFRGRPAGFYELLSGEPVVGQVVQRLSNRLDAGSVLAFAETKAHAYSYRATMSEAYRASPLLLAQAIRNARAGCHLDMEPGDQATRLPGPVTVGRFVVGRFSALVRRLAYGMVVEKSWRVALAEHVPAGFPAEGDLPKPTAWQHVSLPKGYRFLADPFFHPDGSGLLVEALRSSTGLGEILHIDEQGHRPLLSNGHCSYPAAVPTDAGYQLVPEISEHSPALVYRLEHASTVCVGRVAIGGGARLLDPTPFHHDGHCYLFANLAEEGPSVLRLWVGCDLTSGLMEHPDSPIRLSPAGARMGGLIMERSGQVFRVGQDLRRSYGDGLIVFAIEDLTPDRYREVPIADLRFTGVRGPHTLNLRGDTMLFDYYDDRIAPLAAIHRLRGRFARRR